MARGVSRLTWEKPVSWQRRTGNSSPPELREQTASGIKAHAMSPEEKVFCLADNVKGLNCQRQGFWEPAPAHYPTSTSKSDFFFFLSKLPLFVPLLMCPSSSSLSWNTITWTPQWLQFRLPSPFITSVPPNSCENLATLILLFFTLSLLYLNKKIIQLLHSWPSSIAHERS